MGRLGDELLDSDGHSDMDQLEARRYDMNPYGKKLKDGDRIRLRKSDGVCTPGWYRFKSKGCIDSTYKDDCECTPCFFKRNSDGSAHLYQTIEDFRWHLLHSPFRPLYLCMVEQAICEGLI